jgi:hypothetical protein
MGPGRVLFGVVVLFFESSVCSVRYSRAFMSTAIAYVQGVKTFSQCFCELV